MPVSTSLLFVSVKHKILCLSNTQFFHDTQLCMGEAAPLQCPCPLCLCGLCQNWGSTVPEWWGGGWVLDGQHALLVTWQLQVDAVHTSCCGQQVPELSSVWCVATWARWFSAAVHGLFAGQYTGVHTSTRGWLHVLRCSLNGLAAG